jgi:hypothetical protein
MNRKVFVSALALLLALSAAVFANGKKEAPQARAGAQAEAVLPPWASGEKLTLTGTLSLKDSWHPVLVSGGKEYELHVPRRMTLDIDVKDGDQVSVEGYVVENPPSRTPDDGATDLFVTKATIGGKEYDLSQYRGAMMGRGMRGGPGGGPGGGRGWGGDRGRGPGRGMRGPGWGPGWGPGQQS